MMPPPPPFHTQADGRRRFPPRLDTAAFGVFDALLPPNCSNPGGTPQRVGCVGVPRTTAGPLPQLAHSSSAGAPYGLKPAHAGLQSEVSFSSSSTFPGGTAWTYAAELVDVDGDGDLDLVIGNYDAANELLLNDG